MESPFAGPVHNRLHGRCVLVVEDEALVAMLIEEELLDAGIRILGPAHDVEGALHCIQAAAPEGIDAAVLDMNLQGVPSGPVAAALAARGIPFVIATGYGDARFAEAPDAPVIRKPFDGPHLVALLGDLLRPEAREALARA